MAWFGRGKVRLTDRGCGRRRRGPHGDESMIDDAGMGPLRPGPPDRQRQARIDGLAALAAGVSVDDLVRSVRHTTGSMPVARHAWSKRPDHDLIVEICDRIGEHRPHHRLALAHRHRRLRHRHAPGGSEEGDFVVVPTNLVAARWMRTEIGWIPAWSAT